MEETSTTDPLVILRENVIVTLLHKILLRVDVNETARTHTIMPKQEIKTIDRYLKCFIMVRTTNTPDEYDGCSQNPGYS